MGCLVIKVNQVPPSSSSPNARAHWAKRYRDTLGKRGYAEAVFYECLDLRNQMEAAARQPLEPFKKARLDLTFVFAQRRRRDPDNYLAATKSAIDALVKAGLLIDDNASHLTIGQIKLAINKDLAPLTVLVLTEKSY